MVIKTCDIEIEVSPQELLHFDIRSPMQLREFVEALAMVEQRVVGFKKPIEEVKREEIRRDLPQEEKIVVVPYGTGENQGDREVLEGEVPRDTLPRPK